MQQEEDDEDKDCTYDPIFDLKDFYVPREPRIGDEYQVVFRDINFK